LSLGYISGEAKGTRQKAKLIPSIFQFDNTHCRANS
jgi:hypothetical protein